MKLLKLTFLLTLIIGFTSCTEENLINENQTSNSTLVTRYLGSVPYLVKEYDGGYLMGGDMLWSKGQLTEKPTTITSTASNGRLSTGKDLIFSRWKLNKVAFTISNDLSGLKKSRITSAIEHWEDVTNLRFVERTNEENYIAFINNDTDGNCYSSVGMVGGRQTIRLSDSCGVSETIHEIGHAIGLFHEQNRSDRDQYLNIIYDNIDDDFEYAFNKYSDNGYSGTEYTETLDYNSNMIYRPFDFSTNGKPSMTKLDGSTDFGPSKELSAGDIEGINKMYPSIQPGSVDDILNVTLTGKIESLTRLKLAINYSATQSRDIIILVQQDHAPWNISFSQTINVNPANNVLINWSNVIPLINENDTYQIQTILAPTGGNWNNKLDNFLATEGSGSQGTTDDIISVNAPNQVSAGANANVTVNFSATTNRDILVLLQQSNSPWSTQVMKTIQVNAGNNQSTTVSLSVPSNINTNDTYQFQTILAPTGAGWNNKLDNLQSTVSATSGGNGNSQTLTLRAQGNCGQETMVLEVNGSNVKTWNNISKTKSNYTWDGYTGGVIKVKFVNDGNNGCDRNFHLDEIKVGNTTYQTETSATRTGCGNSEWLWCNGNFNFGNK